MRQRLLAFLPAVSLAFVPTILHAQATGRRTPPTVAEATAFIVRAESTLNDLNVKASRVDWVANTYAPT